MCAIHQCLLRLRYMLPKFAAVLYESQYYVHQIFPAPGKSMGNFTCTESEWFVVVAACRVFVGTVSEFCVKHAECPVITIKRKATEAPQDPIDD